MEILLSVIGPEGWKSRLPHESGNRFIFRMDRHEFDLSSQLDNNRFISLDIDFGYTENFGYWSKIK